MRKRKVKIVPDLNKIQITSLEEERSRMNISTKDKILQNISNDINKLLNGKISMDNRGLQEI